MCDAYVRDSGGGDGKKERVRQNGTKKGETGNYSGKRETERGGNLINSTCICVRLYISIGSMGVWREKDITIIYIIYLNYI